ncbi:MAG: DinB family protein [bacterium]|nr:DinB family protein [bacterium]
MVTIDVKTELNDVAEIIDGLEKSPKILKTMIAQIPDALLNERRIKGKWSIHEHACHLMEVQPMLIKRFETFKREPNPVFKPFIPDDVEEDHHLMKMDLKDSLAKFGTYREEMAVLLKGFSGEELQKQGKHPEYKIYTPHLLMRHVLMHDHLHMYRIEELWLTEENYLP